MYTIQSLITFGILNSLHFMLEEVHSEDTSDYQNNHV